MGLTNWVPLVGKSETEKKLEASMTPMEFVVMKIKRGKSNQIQSKEEIITDDIPITQNQAEMALEGFEPGYTYKLVVKNMRGQYMDEADVRNIFDEDILWAEKSGSTELEKALRKMKDDNEMSDWEKVNSNPRAFVALQAIESGNYEEATNLFTNGAPTDDDFGQQVENMQKLQEAEVGPETVKAAGWMNMVGFIQQMQNPDFWGDVTRNVLGNASPEQQGGQQQGQEQADQEAPSGGIDQSSPTDEFEQLVEGSSAPDDDGPEIVEEEVEEPIPEETPDDVDAFPDTDDLADEFEEEQEPEPPDQTPDFESEVEDVDEDESEEESEDEESDATLTTEPQ